MKRNPIGWFEIYVNDMARARKFYESVLETKLSQLPSGDLEMWAFPGDPHSAGATGALVRMPGMDAGKNSVIVYFTSNDCSVEEKRVAGAGGKVFKPKFSIGQYGFISLVHDSEGNVIGLHSMS